VLFSPPPPPGVFTGVDATVEVQPVNVAEFPMTSALTYWGMLPRVFHRVEERIGRFDVVHSNVYADFLLTRRAGSGVRVLTIYHLGSTAAASAGLRLPSRLLRLSSEYGPAVIAEGVCLKRADHIIAISNFTRSDILRRYPNIAPERVSVIYLGTGLEPRPPSDEDKTWLMRRWGITHGERIALGVGRLEDRKGIPFLLQAFSQTPSASNVKLVLVGSGPTEAYELIARRLGIADRVVFAGYVDDSVLRAAYRIADVFVHAASMEGFGLSLADAVAIGLPVVATRAGSIPEVVRDGVDGSLVEYGDTQAFAKALMGILDGTHATIQTDLGSQLERFSWNGTVRKTLDLYEELLTYREHQPASQG
jgi:glycosyltransferase involved in cell wall biosynthesis